MNPEILNISESCLIEIHAEIDYFKRDFTEKELDNFFLTSRDKKTKIETLKQYYKDLLTLDFNKNQIIHILISQSGHLKIRSLISYCQNNEKRLSNIHLTALLARTQNSAPIELIDAHNQDLIDIRDKRPALLDDMIETWTIPGEKNIYCFGVSDNKEKLTEKFTQLVKETKSNLHSHPEKVQKIYSFQDAYNTLPVRHTLNKELNLDIVNWLELNTKQQEYLNDSRDFALKIRALNQMAKDLFNIHQFSKADIFNFIKPRAGHITIKRLKKYCEMDSERLTNQQLSLILTATNQEHVLEALIQNHGSMMRIKQNYPTVFDKIINLLIKPDKKFSFMNKNTIHKSIETLIHENYWACFKKEYKPGEYQPIPPVIPNHLEETSIISFNNQSIISDSQTQNFSRIRPTTSTVEPSSAQNINRFFNSNQKNIPLRVASNKIDLSSYLPRGINQTETPTPTTNDNHQVLPNEINIALNFSITEDIRNKLPELSESDLVMNDSFFSKI